MQMETNKQTSKIGVAILISDKINFNTKAIIRDKEGPSNFTSACLFKETQNTNLKKTYVY